MPSRAGNSPPEADAVPQHRSAVRRPDFRSNSLTGSIDRMDPDYGRRVEAVTEEARA